jgi:hypothetical protein
MAGPAAVIVAGVITTWIAVTTSDGMVADDYYKRGLAINQTLRLDDVARERGYRARIAAAGAGQQLVIRVAGGEAHGAWRGPLIVRLTHPGQPARDRTLNLTPDADGVFTAPAPGAGRWGITLEDPAGAWRLMGVLHAGAAPSELSIELTPR